MKKRIDPKLPIPVLGDASTPDPAVTPDGYQDRLNRRLNELFLDFDGTLSIYDEGTYLGEADGINLIGTAVAAVASTSMPGVYDITVTGGGGSGITGITVEDEGVTQGSPSAVDTLNFVGAAVAATVTSNVATITVTGGAQQPIYVYFA